MNLRLIGAGVAALTAGLLGLVYVYQEKLLYMNHHMPQFKTPSKNPPYFRRPNEHGIEYDEAVYVTEDGKRIHGWFMRAPRHRGFLPGDYTQQPTVIFFHGNAGNRGFRLFNMKQLVELGLNVLIIDYRGYAESEGEPSEEGLVLDARASLDYLRNRGDVDMSKIIVYGRSLGGAVALALHETHGEYLRAVALENTFTSVADMVDALMPRPLALLKGLLLRMHWRSLERIPSVQCPLLLLSSERDELIPPTQMRQLHEAATSRRTRFVSFELGTHNELPVREPEKYTDTWRSFLVQEVFVQEMALQEDSSDVNSD
ncbi:MAG: hypothetical protein MHM6MM_004642 [Cercozoa sp. M6MM]